MAKILENFPLQNHNTFAIPAHARYYAEFADVEQLCHLIKLCREQNVRWYILGDGANVLFSNDFDGMIIRSAMRNILVDNQGLILADAGVEWDDLVAWSVERGYGGLENLSYIPGSVGASPIQNIGAYGVEVKDSLEWVEYLDVETMDIVRVANGDCKFGYRESVFKGLLKGRAVILRVAFRLSQGRSDQFNIGYGDVAAEVEKRGGASLRSVRDAIIFIRKSKLPEPKELGNAGSFFKNPVVSVEKFDELRERFEDLKWFDVEGCEGKKIPAGWMIERAGWKGRREGNVGMHERQALVMVNYGGASGAEILAYASRVQAAVFEMFGVEIEMEVNVV